MERGLGLCPNGSCLSQRADVNLRLNDSEHAEHFPHTHVSILFSFAGEEEEDIEEDEEAD